MFFADGLELALGGRRLQVSKIVDVLRRGLRAFLKARMRQEIHDAEKMVDHAYIERQFPEISYGRKIGLIRDIYTYLHAHDIFESMPSYWRNILINRSERWEPMEREEVTTVVTTLKALREMPDYFLRNVTINIVQSIVRIQFNCDGTQIVSAENYTKFLEENLPA